MTKKLETVQDFIDFFEPIPEDLWIKANLGGEDENGEVCHCALGWLGVTTLEGSTEYVFPDETVEHNVKVLGSFLGEEKESLSGNARNVYQINDANYNCSPKKNILNALKKTLHESNS